MADNIKNIPLRTTDHERCNYLQLVFKDSVAAAFKVLPLADWQVWDNRRMMCS